MYNPYNMQYPYMQTGYNADLYAKQANPNVLPAQQVIQVAGKASIDTLQMSPNSSILIMDTTAPIVWLCVSDGLGKVTATAYDISVHQDVPPVDVNALEQRVTNMESMINAYLEAQKNEQSNDTGARSEPKHTNSWNGKPKTD